MQRYKITIEYNGTHFFGWQKQNDAVSIQGSIENAINEFGQPNTEVFGSGRTDAGVHALGQVAHFDLNKTYEPYDIKNALNYFLKSDDIYIKKVELVDQEFHARFSALERSYIYKIFNSPEKSVFNCNQAWHIKKHIDYQAMNDAAQLLVGKHDFSSFRAGGCQAKGPIKTINAINITKEKDIISLHITAPSFLYNQVRITTGSLYKIGIGEWGKAKLSEVLKSKDRTQNSITAPAHGLYFLSVKY